MTFLIPDRVQETTATTGTGTLTLAGASAGCQTFSAGVGNGNTCPYVIAAGNGTDFETGIGTYTSSGNTLARTLIISSTNANAAISLTGTSTVFVATGGAWAMSRLAAPIVPPPAAGSWTARNSSILTNVGNGVQCTAASSVTATTRAVSMATIASPGTPYTIDINASAGGLSSATGANNGIIPLFGWCDGTKYSALVLMFINSNFQAEVLNYTSATVFTSIASTVYYYPFNLGDMWARLADNGTNVTFSASPDGVNWEQVYTVAKSSGFLGATGYSNIGFGVDSLGSATGVNQWATLRSWYQH